jgi:hypothetical protein
MRSFIPLTFLVSLFLCIGCADRSHPAAVEKQIEDLRGTVSELKREVEDLKRGQSLSRFISEAEGIAYLTPSSEGYSVVQTDLGRITISLENIQAYANGSRVTLRFGNLTSATINGVNATVEWGCVDAHGAPINDAARSRKVTLEQSLRAGAWTDITLALENVPPTSLGFIRVKEIGHRGISLLR